MYSLICLKDYVEKLSWQLDCKYESNFTDLKQFFAH